MNRERLASLAGIAALACLGVWAFMGLEVRQEITDFVPDAEERELGALARQIASSDLSRTAVLTIGTSEGEPDPERSAAAAHALADALRGAPQVDYVETGAPEGAQTAFYDLYFPRRMLFAAQSAEQARERFSDEGLARAAEELRGALTGPTAMLVRRIAPQDPLMIFPAQLRRMQGSERARLVDGALVSEDGRWGVVLVGSRATPFEGVASRAFLRSIDEASDAARQALDAPELEVEQASIHRFALQAEEGIRADVQRISIVSSIGVVLLFLVLYRGPRYLALGAIPLLAGTVVGTAACRVVFGGAHGVTFAFGSALLGVAIDFVAHLVNHHLLEPGEGGAWGSARRIRGGLVLGAATTVAGLAGLAWTSFPVMREMALFAGSGVTAALLATLLLVPPWMPPKPAAPPLARAIADRFERLWLSLSARRAPFAIVPALALLVALIGLPQLAWQDDLRRLNEPAPELRAEDDRVRARVGQGEPGRFVLALGDTDEEALVHADAAESALRAALEAGELEGYRSVHPFLPSAATQRAVREVIRQDATLGPRTLAALEAQGFVPALFEPFVSSLAHSPEPLVWEDFAGTPIESLVRPFHVELGEGDSARRAFVTFIRGVDDPEALRERLESVPGVTYFDQGAFLTSAYGRFRSRTLELVGFGLVFVFALCLLRYRSPRLAFASLAPALLASAATLGGIGLLGGEANLMHLVGSLLVLSMGEDYAVFLVEAVHRGRSRAQTAREISTTMVGLVVACLTTVLSFGLLATSSHPAMRALGTMASVGVLSSLLLAPLAVLLAGGRAADAPEGAEQRRSDADS